LKEKERRWEGNIEINLKAVGYEGLAGLCENGNEISGFIKGSGSFMTS
jgi:hypothetical protein